MAIGMADVEPSHILSEVMHHLEDQFEFNKIVKLFHSINNDINLCENFECGGKDLSITSLLGCCHKVIHLHDVMIFDGALLVYNGSTKTKYCTKSGSNSLPFLVHRFPGPVWTSQIPVDVKHQSLPLHSCNGYFNGTLHVSGRKTLHKLFHLLNDNMLPLMTQIILDLFLAPEYAHLPHMSLSIEDIPLLRASMSNITIVKQLRSQMRRNNRKNMQTRTLSRQQRILTYNTQISRMRLPHMGIYEKLFEGGEIDINAAHGMCFRRVAWGSGLRMHYTDAMVVLRRLTADFARLLAMMTYNPPIPPPFIQQQQRTVSKRKKHIHHRAVSQELVRYGRPLRVVYLSRGSTGRGRSLSNVEVILDRLARGGASVFQCDETYLNMTSQLSCVVHADVIIGLHGAALVNAIFAPRGCILVELKTLYGYTTDIFTRTADSREGMYIHIDIRNYSSPRRIHKADIALAGRIERALVEALRTTDSTKQGEGRIHQLTAASQTNFLIEPSLTSGELGHVLGPTLKYLNYTCKRVLSYAFYRQVMLKGNKMEHCSPCHQEWERVF
eukprot:gene4027-8017_t